jgi:hypothetical protein
MHGGMGPGGILYRLLDDDPSRYAAIQRWLDRVRNQQRHIAQMYDDSAVPAEAFI